MSHPANSKTLNGRELDSVDVLLIDDDEDDYLITRELFDDFADERYQLDWTDGFDDGLEKLVGGDYDICLLDYRLGAQDGVELLKRAVERDNTTPVVILTGADDRSIDRAAMRHGAIDYLVKSEITAGLLERTIRYSLERHRFAQQQRKLAAENERLYQQAQQALEMRDEMHRIVAHDLKNPLNTMGLALQLMERHVRNDADAEQFSRQLETQRLCISRMKRLIQDLLDAARIEDGRLELQRVALRPNELIERALEEHEIAAADESVELVGDAPGDLPFIDVDARRMAQVFANLISNAIKFTAQGGTVELSAEVAGDGDIVRFSVSDTGRGIAEDKLPHLFERFWQEDREEARGAGLGLAICKGLVEAHGGEIWAESTPGEGSTFSFTVPLAE